MTGTEARMIATWQAPLEGGKTSEELLVTFDAQRDCRVLIVPALFDEANKLRRFTVQTMRALDAAGIDSFLPDLPGCNDSLVPIQSQTISSLQDVVKAAFDILGATHVLSIRGGSLLTPKDLPGWQYAPLKGAKLLRGMLRARIINSREADIEETSESLLERGRIQGLPLAGWEIGAAMLQELEAANPPDHERQVVITQSELGGAGLWLRAEPDENQATTDALAAIIATSHGASS